MAKILIVDSKKEICYFSVKFFEDRNFKAFSAESGREALEIAANEKPEIALLEMSVEGMGGLPVLKRIREISPDTKVIVVTDIDDMEIMDEARKLGAVAYLTKPVLLSQLLDIVLKNLDKKRSFFKLKVLSKG